MTNSCKYFYYSFYFLIICFGAQPIASSGASYFLKNNLNPVEIIASMGGSGISISANISAFKEAFGGTDAPLHLIHTVGSHLDGVQDLSGFTSFTVTTIASNSGDTVSIIGNDGSPAQTYSIRYLSPIVDGATFTLTNGSKSITFENNSESSISSASALATYLAGAYPVDFVISDSIIDKISAIRTLLVASTSGGAAGTNTSLYGKILSALAGGGSSSGSSVGAYILGTPTGDDDADLGTARAHLIISLGATLQADIQTINAFLNGLSTWGSTTTQGRIGDIFSQIDGTADYSGNISSKLTTQIQLVQNTATQFSTATSSVLAILGGSNSDLYRNLVAANSALGGSGATTIAKIGSLGSAASLFAMIGATGLADLATALGNTSLGNSTIAALLKSGSTSTSLYALIVGPTGILSQIDGTTTDSGNISGKLTTQIQLVQNTATQFSTATSAVLAILGGSNSDLYRNLVAANSALGGINTTTDRINTANATLDGVQSLSGLSSFTVSNAATNSGSMVSIIGNDGSGMNTYSVIYDSSIANGATFTLTNSGSGNSIAFVNNSGGSITSASDLASYLANAYPVNTVIKANTNNKITALKNFLGGNSYSAMSNAAALFAIVGGFSSDLYSNLGNPGDGKTLIDNIGGSSDSVQAALNALSAILFANSNFSSSLYIQAGSLNSTLDSGVVSLPGDSTYGTIGTSALSDGSGGVNLVISSGFGSASGTYNLSSSTISGGIGNGSTFTLSNGSNSLVLYNRSGSTINTQSQALSYLGSMYPMSSKIATTITDKISSIKTMLGVSGSSVQGKVAAIDALLLRNPTGILASDLTSARTCFVTTPGATVEDDAQSLNSIVDGAASGSTLQARIGTPIINGSSSNLAAVIGGEGDIASRLGDPVTATSGVSALINASNAHNENGVFNDLSTLQGATNITDQMNAFLALFGNLAGGATSVTFDFSGGTPTSLADFVSKAVIFSPA